MEKEGPASARGPRSSFPASPEAVVNRLILIVMSLTLGAAPAAHAYDLVYNGGFESGSLSSWQTFNQGASGGTGSWYANSGGNGSYSGLPTSPPPAGSWQAVADNSGRAAAILYQDIAIPATARATISFTIWLGNTAPGGTYTNGSSLSPTITNQRVRLDLIDPAANLLITSSGVKALLYQTGAGTPAVVNPTQVTVDVTPLAGQTVRLRAALVATTGAMIAGIDQVKLDVSPFATITPTAWGMIQSECHWGDVDDDGQMELGMVGDLGSGSRWGFLLRNQGGSWQDYFPLPALGLGYGFAFVDVDADGRLDVTMGVYATGSDGFLTVSRNVDPYTFSTVWNPINTWESAIAWGDYDNDGDLDAMVSGLYAIPPDIYAQPATLLALNDGSGNLSASLTVLPGTQKGCLVWADPNADAYRDLLLAGSGETDYFYGDIYGNLTGYSNGLDNLLHGCVAVADLDNDGSEELIVAGNAVGDVPTAKIYSQGWFGWYESMTGLPPCTEASLALGDFDSDGYTDIALSGLSGVTRFTRLYHNNGNGTFSDTNAGLPGLANGAMEFGDYDNDGDLDLLFQGFDGATQRTLIAINTPPSSNMAPTPPGSLYAYQNNSELWLLFGAYGSDDHTPQLALTHNFRAGTTSGSCNAIPPMSNLTSGRRLVAAPGQSNLATYRRLRIDRIGHNHDIWWSVQSVDQSFKGSAWAPEQRFVLGPTIQSVADVPNDQGGRVRLAVQRSMFDSATQFNYPAAGYNVWRFVPPGALAGAVASDGVAVDPEKVHARLAGASEGDEHAEVQMRALDLVRGAKDLTLVEYEGRLFARSAGQNIASPFPAGLWEVVGSFFAVQESDYLVATTSLADSGATGPNEQTYMVTMHTTTPSVWFASLPVSGHSVDNLAPAPPVGLTANYHTGNGNHLSWQPAPEPDFESFRVYRGTSEEFVPSPATLVTAVSIPMWDDPAYDSPLAFYKISTTDHAGNESAAVSPTSTTAVGVADLPVAFAFGTPSPNPFGDATRFTFALPRGALAKLEIYDTAGRRVRRLVDGWRAAGNHDVRWRGDDDAGNRVEAGVYFCRFEAGAFRTVRRVARMP